MLKLKDNSSYESDAASLDEFLALQLVANRNLSELLDEQGHSLLVYPHSFRECKDGIGNGPLLTMQTNWKERQCTKVSLQLGNIAGFLGVDGYSYSILSRFSDDEEDFFLHYMLQKVLCVNVVNLSHDMTSSTVFDFLLYLFPKMLNDAMAQGLYKAYRWKDYNDAHVRGTIDLNRHLKVNLPFRGKVAYHTREFSYDNPVTELIRHTIEYLSQHTLGKALLVNDARTRDHVAAIRMATPAYNRLEREKVIRGNIRPVNHPYFSRYTALQKLCMAILRHDKMKYGGGGQKIHGVLFDVAYLWEEYLATILLEEGFKHPDNRRKTGRIYLAENNRLVRYPDFYREEDELVVDAKYKFVVDERNDVHQLMAYMYYFKAQRGVFVLPSTEVREQNTYKLLGHGKEKNVKLQEYFYLIPQRSDSYRQFVSAISQSEQELRREFAKIGTG